MTAKGLQALLPSAPVLAVVPTDAFPAGQWSGATRTIHGWNAADAVPARLLEVRPRLDPQTHKRRTCAHVEYLPPASGRDHFLPGAVLGLWADLQEMRDAAVNYPDRATRAARVAAVLGAGVHPADREHQRPAVFLTVEAAERLARSVHAAQLVLNADRIDLAGDPRTPEQYRVGQMLEAARWLDEITAPTAPIPPVATPAETPTHQQHT